jgi:phytanoyl-CoA hydroxylase
MYQNTTAPIAPVKFQLTAEQAKSYDEEGYILVKGLLSAEKVDLYNRRFADIANGVVPKKPLMILMKDITIAKKNLNGEAYITKLQEFQDDEVMFGYCREQGILDYVKAIIGENVLAIHTMFINKPPDTGMGTSVHPSHQDLFYFPFRPHENVISVWTAMENVNMQNGCLYVLPGSHKPGILLEHTYPKDKLTNKGYLGIHSLTQEDEEKFIYLEMQPGDTLFFNTLLIHGSGPNLSASTRKACSTHYAAADCELIDVSGTLQEDFAREMETWAVEKIGLPQGISFNEIWSGKSRKV